MVLWTDVSCTFTHHIDSFVKTESPSVHQVPQFSTSKLRKPCCMHQERSILPSLGAMNLSIAIQYILPREGAACVRVPAAKTTQNLRRRVNTSFLVQSIFANVGPSTASHRTGEERRKFKKESSDWNGKKYTGAHRENGGQQKKCFSRWR